MKNISGLVVGVALLTGGCRLLIDVDEPMCESNPECTDVFGDTYFCNESGVCEALDDADIARVKWETRYPCLFDGGVEAPAADADGKVDLSVQVIDYVTASPLESLGITVKACEFTRSCDSPLFEETFDNNQVNVSLDYGFTGTLQFYNGYYLDTILHSNRPYVEDVDMRSLSLIAEQALQIQAQQAGEELVNPNMLVVETLDCDGNAAEGVVLTNGDAVGDTSRSNMPFYFTEDQPDRDLLATSVSQQVGPIGDTTPRSVGGWTSLSPGNLEITGTLQDTNIVFGQASVNIQNGQMVQIQLYPMGVEE